MQAKPLPPQAHLLARLKYDPTTGVIVWLSKDVNSGKDAGRWNSRYAGQPAGRRHPKGHVVAMLDGQFYAAHRLIWRMVTGDDPGENEIDHRDTDGGNNRWLNLRLADRSSNCSNVKCKSYSTTQIKGVHPVPSGRFVAKICVKRKYLHLGTYDTAAQAAAAYASASAKYRGEFMRLA